MRRLITTAAGLVLTMVLLTACSDEEKAPETVHRETRTIKVTFANGTVTPAGDRVQVFSGQEILFEVTADEPGEIHVHSSPGQTLKYGTGETSLPLTINDTGIVEVESHNLDKLMVQLEVR